MALSFNSYSPKPHDTLLQLSTHEVVSLRNNSEIFYPSGQVKSQAKFSVERDTQLFTLSWPKTATKCVSTLSRWQLVVSAKATKERIATFNAATAANLGCNNWQVVKKVVEECRTKFQARLLAMSNQEIVFAHGDRQSAERMKDSNEMVDILNSLLADLESKFQDILVDWNVKVTPVTVSLSYQPFDAEDDQTDQEDSKSLLLTDADSPPLMNSRASRDTSVNEAVPPYVQRLMEVVAAESRRTQEALARMSNDNTHRHRIVCQKIEELKSHMRQLPAMDFTADGADRKGQSDAESDQNNGTDNSQTYNQTANHYDITSAQLYESDIRAQLFESDIQDRRHGGPKKPQQQAKQEQMRQEQAQKAPPPTSRSYQNSQQPSQPPPQPQPQPRPQPQPPRQTASAHGRRGSFTDDFRREDSVKPSETFRDSLSGSDLENRNLDEAVERAYRHDDVPPPRAKSYHTVLCLDCSASMGEHGAFQQMKDVVNTFIDGVEDVVTDSGVEENIGVVVFGGMSTVVQNLTNDFTRVRDAIDNVTEPQGRSPFVQALLVSMAAFVEKAGIISVSGVYDVKPRIIFISDGYPTENIEEGLDFANNKMHVRTSLTRLMMSFATKRKYTKVQPVVYIPVGGNPDTELMRSMASLSKGQFVEPQDVDKLCTYFMLQETIGKTLACVKSSEGELSEEDVRAIATGLMPNLDEDQKAEVVKSVLAERKEPSHKHRGSRTGDLEDTYENTEKVDAGEMLPLGTRVVRGPDWHWGDQDGNGPGTVFSHLDKDGWTRVCWDAEDKGHNRYAYGPDMGYEIWKTDKHPRFMDLDQDLKIGMTVEKGPDWSCSSESLQSVRYGIVIRKSRTRSKLMIRWDNGELQVVRWGAKDKYDVMYCDPTTIQVETPFEYQSASEDPTSALQFTANAQAKAKPQQSANAGADPPDIFEESKWQWKDQDGQWRDYLPEHSQHIEKNYQRSYKKDKRPSGSCIITRDGINRRVMFSRMTEKQVESGVECSVRRVPV